MLNAHVSLDTGKRRSHCMNYEPEPPSITSLVHIGEHFVGSSSSKSLSGIRIWDIRYQKEQKPLRILALPSGPSKKQTGITSLAMDRYCSKLFAVCTDKRILIYDAQSNSSRSSDCLKTFHNNTFQIQCVTSPVSDHLACGSIKDAVYVYDLQVCVFLALYNVIFDENCLVFMLITFGNNFTNAILSCFMRL